MQKQLCILFIAFIANILPVSADSLFVSLPDKMRDSYVNAALAYHNQEWKTIPATIFARFKKDGNRVEYENLCFQRRTQLAMLVMGEVVEGKNRFLSDIINGLQVIMEETWWGIPAHYNRAIPSYDNQTVDLFNAETAGLMAWTMKMLKPQLDKYEPSICRRISKEIEHRILRPALGSKYWWKTASMNWNPWICSNWLTCVILCEADSLRREKAIAEIQGCMDSFINNYPDDGGCDEGTGYWDRAAASLYECMQLLHDAGVDDSKYRNNPKVRNMASYIYKMYIGNDYCVNFADAHDNKNVVQLNVLYPFALYLDDKEMRQYAAHVAKTSGFFDNPAVLYAKSGNFPTIGRELRLLENYARLRNEIPHEPQVEAWLPDLQIKTLRTSSLFVAFKGGNNGESHNHNDVGSFIIYADGKPLLIDPGVGEYTSQTFGKNRYDIWTMQSQYHNLPQVNGFDQHDGKQYCASLVRQDSKGVTLDIAKSYPAEAKLQSWMRSVKVKGKKIEISDAFALEECHVPTRLMYVTTTLPDVAQPGKIVLGSHSLLYPQKDWKASVEDLSDRLDNVLKHLWGDKMYRVVLTAVSNDLKGEIKMVVE